MVLIQDITGKSSIYNQSRRVAGLMLVMILGLTIVAPSVAHEAESAPIPSVTPKRNLLIDAERLLQAQRYDEAYRLLASFREMRDGEPNFEFLLGRAALQTGHPSEAITVFERILSRIPGNVLVRIWLAQAYLAAGERDRANKEYMQLDALYLPETLSQFVKSQLLAMEQGTNIQTSALTKPMWSGYLELSGGYDTNINSATNAGQIYIPALGNLPLTLSGQVRQHEAASYSLGSGLQVVAPIITNVTFYARGDVRYQNNDGEKDYNSSQGNLGAGFVLLSGKHMARIGINGAVVKYRGAGNHDILGTDLEYAYSINPKNQLTAFLGYAQYRFERDFEINDVNRVVGGIGYKHAFDFYNSNISFSVFSGQEDDVAPRTLANPNGGRIDGKQDFYGFALNGRIIPWKDVELHAATSWQHGSYGKENIIFMDTRKDNRVNATIGAVVNLGSDWSLRPLYSFTKSDTNIPINDYERNVLSVNLRKDFR